MKKVLDRIGNSDYFLKRLWFCLLCVAVLSNVQAQETYIVKYHSTGGKTFPKVTSAKGEVTSTATVSLVGAGGAGGTGTGTNNGAGGGGGGASVTVAGYDVKNYTFPMNIGAGSSGAGQATTIGSPVEATAKGGSAGTHQSYGNGGSASSTGTISSNYGSNVRIISSYSGGYGGSAANGSTPDAGAGGSGGGISASGRSGGNGGTGIHVGASGGSAPDKFAGNGGSGANCLTLLFFIVTDGSSGASGGGGGGGGVRAIDSNQWYYGNPGSGGNGRVWVHFEYTYTGQNRREREVPINIIR